MMKKMQKLIFCPNLENIVLDVIKSCPVCTLCPDKKLFLQCGSQRSTVYRPLQAIIIDSLYLPSDKLQNSKALIIKDSCTSKICIFPGRDLQASTARKHIFNYLLCHPSPDNNIKWIKEKRKVRLKRQQLAVERFFKSVILSQTFI